MKKTLLFLLLLHHLSLIGGAQITGPVINANFGVDADLRSNYFNGALQSGNDDWFRLPGFGGTGEFVIDTTGAAALLARYAIDPAYRKLPFYRTMRFPTYSVVNNRLLIDAVFVRDYHGDDSTIFAAGSNKNGMNPQTWTCPVEQSVPDKNEILDMMMHVRRAGPNTTDSLWMIGGLSIENTTGNRYFDFEMYQTDIYYDRASRQFYGYGPDAGHTSWKFDAAGNVTTPGDIIFTAEYSSSSLTLVEARIWVKYSDWLTVAPTGFNWSGLFDGAGSGATYGYASITPNTAGRFYTGLQSANSTWAGSFSLVLGDNSVTTTYTTRQYMEFSVNLTKVGLDPVTLLGGNACGMPFRRVLVKSRASTSFTSELKDFVGPFDFFLAPRALVATNAPYICPDSSVSNVYVTNPVSTSTYIWSTVDGTISGSNTGASINVTSPGTYTVTQYLQGGCSAYATAALQVLPFSACTVLQNNLTDFSGNLDKNVSRLKWVVQENSFVSSFDLERSYDGIHFTLLKKIFPIASEGRTSYDYDDNVEGVKSGAVFYRLKVNQVSGVTKYSRILHMPLLNKDQFALSVMPNPVKDFIQVTIYSSFSTQAKIKLFDPLGRMIKSDPVLLEKGSNSFNFEGLDKYPPGIYQLVVDCNRETISKKLVVVK